MYLPETLCAWASHRNCARTPTINTTTERIILEDYQMSILAHYTINNTDQIKLQAIYWTLILQNESFCSNYIWVISNCIAYQGATMIASMIASNTADSVVYTTDQYNMILMAQCKKDVTPLLTHWSYIFLALTHHHDIWYCMITTQTEYCSKFNLTKDYSILCPHM